MKKTLSFKLCIIVFYLLVFIAFIIEKRPILSNSTPYFSRIANATNLVLFYYNPNSNYQALQMNIIMKVFLVMPIALYYVIKKDCTLGQLITFILGASFIFEVAKLLSLRGFFDITDFFYYMAGRSRSSLSPDLSEHGVSCQRLLRPVPQKVQIFRSALPWPLQHSWNF